MAKELTKITKSWPINKILEIYPDSVTYMQEIGLSCFSCSANTQERLNQGMKLHGFTNEQIDELVAKINQGFQIYQSENLKTPTPADFTVEKIVETTANDSTTYYKIAGLLFTQTAYDALHELIEDLAGLQIKIDAGGCSGYSYLYDFTNSAQPDEDSFAFSSRLQLFINPFTFNKLSGTIIDFKFGIKDAGLKFINPNIKDSCHCGTSVGF
jgi:iron-sulfur cluster assembly accessory protein